MQLSQHMGVLRSLHFSKWAAVMKTKQKNQTHQCSKRATLPKWSESKFVLQFCQKNAKRIWQFRNSSMAIILHESTESISIYSSSQWAAFLRSSLGREWVLLTLKVWPSVRRCLAEWAEAGQVMKLVPCRVLSAVKDTLNQHAVLKPVVRGSNPLSASNVWSRNLKIPPRTSWEKKKERKKCYAEWRNMNMARVLWGRIAWQRRMKMFPRKGWNTLTKERNFQNVEKLELQHLDSSEYTWEHSCPVCRLLLSVSCSSKVNHRPRFGIGEIPRWETSHTLQHWHWQLCRLKLKLHTYKHTCSYFLPQQSAAQWHATWCGTKWFLTKRKS